MREDELEERTRQALHALHVFEKKDRRARMTRWTKAGKRARHIRAKNLMNYILCVALFCLGLWLLSFLGII